MAQGEGWSRGRRGFALVEAAAVVAMIALLAALLLVTGTEQRRNGRLAECTANLKRIGAASAGFALDRDGLIPGFTWKAGQQDTKHSDLNNASSDIEAAANQAVYIMRELGDRPDMPAISGWAPYILYSHLPLQEYEQTYIPSKGYACPEERYRLNWQDDPKNKFDNGFWLPFQPDPSLAAKRWPYSSSYEFTPSAWDAGQSKLGDDVSRASQGPSANTYSIPGDGEYGAQPLADVLFPDRNVAAYERWQFHFGNARQPFFAIEEARIPLLTFDGSVNVRITATANRGWQPHDPDDPCGEVFFYKPLIWEPPVIGNTDFGGGTIDLVNAGFYRWTRLGLKGIDFAGPEPDTGQGDDDCQ